MIGKKFTSLVDGRIVQIKDVFEDIVILNDNTKVKATRLLDKSFYEEYIDPKNFFQNQSLLNTFAQKIKQIPDEMVSKMSDNDRNILNENLSDPNFRPSFNEPAILLSDPEIEKEELARKYGVKNAMSSSQTEAQKQLEKFESLLRDPEDNGEQVQRIEVNRDSPRVEAVENKEVSNKINQVEDPIITMFKNVKRNKEFKISLDIENKIPRPDFIEMMEDSYNTSIIEFLADEFTNKLLENPDLIRNKIIDEIKKIVYTKTGESIKEVLKEKVQKTARAKRTYTKKSEIIND